MPSPTDRLLPNVEEVAAKVIDGEAILINLTSGVYYSMDGVGALTWDLIERGLSLAEIADRVANRYDVAPEAAREDVERLAGELLDEGLVVIDSRGGAVVLPPDGNGAEPDSRLPYEPPRLTAYNDMSDLMALDPPMPELGEAVWREAAGE